MNFPATFPGTRLSLGKRIKRERSSRGLTLEALARLVGVSKVTVWSWEHDKCAPRLSKFQKLTEVLGITAVDLQSADSLVESNVPDLIADSRRRIAEAAGVEIQNVEIRVTFTSLDA